MAHALPAPGAYTTKRCAAFVAEGHFGGVGCGLTRL